MPSLHSNSIPKKTLPIVKKKKKKRKKYKSRYQDFLALFSSVSFLYSDPNISVFTCSGTHEAIYTTGADPDILKRGGSWLADEENIRFQMV